MTDASAPGPALGPFPRPTDVNFIDYRAECQLLSIYLIDLTTAEHRSPYFGDERRRRRDIFMAAATATWLGYEVTLDEDGWIHIFLPASERNHGHFYFLLGVGSTFSAYGPSRSLEATHVSAIEYRNWAFGLSTGEMR